MLEDPPDGLHADGAGQLWVVSFGHELVVAVRVPQRNVVVAAIGRHAHEGLGHEARERTQLPANLLAHLTVSAQPVGGEFGPVEVEVEFELPGCVFVVALDHVETHRLAVLDHFVDQRLQLRELIDVVAVGFGQTLDGRFAVFVGSQPHHLRLATGTKMQSVLGFELGVDALEVASAVRGEESSAVDFFLTPTKQRAPNPCRATVPRQRHKSLRFGEADQLAGLRPVTDVFTVTVGEQIRGGAVDELEAFAGDHAEMLGRYAFAHYPSCNRKELAVQVCDVVGFDSGFHLPYLFFAAIGAYEHLKISGHVSPN